MKTEEKIKNVIKAILVSSLVLFCGISVYEIMGKPVLYVLIIIFGSSVIFRENIKIKERATALIGFVIVFLSIELKVPTEASIIIVSLGIFIFMLTWDPKKPLSD